jgi:death on curing protein
VANLYITIEATLEIYSKTIEVSGGGSKGIINQGQLESVLAHIQNDSYYPEFIDKLTHLFFSVNRFHCFEDGNKRIAISIGAHFLLINGYVFVVPRFIREMENISYHLAAGKIEKEFLKEIIQAVIDDNMDNEELKLKIIEAISNE